MSPHHIVDSTYFIVAILLILGLKGMSSPVTARRGIVWAGAGMVLATMVTFASPGMGNYGLMILALAIGGGFAWWAGKAVRVTDMPQMVAIFNGMGGGSAAAIAAVELVSTLSDKVTGGLSVAGAIIGSISIA